MSDNLLPPLTPKQREALARLYAGDRAFVTAYTANATWMRADETLDFGAKNPWKQYIALWERGLAAERPATDDERRRTWGSVYEITAAGRTAHEVLERAERDRP
jgi:hypothetical protein